MVSTDCAAATAFFVYDGQARRAMLVEFPAPFFNRLMRAATRRRGPHDLFDTNFGSVAAIRRHAATHVALGDDADQREVFRILNHWRATAP